MAHRKDQGAWRESLEELEQYAVEVIFDPPWNQAMMSDAAKLQLGFF